MEHNADGRVDPFASLLPSVVRSWLGQTGAPPIRAAEASVLSADITGFTRLANELSRRGPREAGEALNQAINLCFEPMIDAALALGGDVLKFGGDALFILFDGHDGDGERDGAVRACQAAARMQQLIAEVDIGTGARLSMTVGVATGPLQLILPPTGRRELLVHGPAVDTCLQLEADAEPGEVLIDEATAASLPPDWVDATDPDVVLLVVDRASTAVAERPLGPPEPTGPVLTDAERTAALGPDLAAAIEAFEGTAGELRTVVVSFVQLETVGLDERVLLDVMSRLDDLCNRYGASLTGVDVDRRGLKLFLAAGAPVSVGDDEDALLATVTQLVGDPSLPPMRGAINRGVVYAGFLGSARCRTFTTMGDATNLAARLLAKAEPRSVVTTQAVLDHARSVYETTELAPILVRGRVEPVIVHRIGALADGRPATATRPRPPFVGRHRELRQLRDLLAATRRGDGSFVEVRGESGIGSSRLIEELVSDLPLGTLLFHVNARLAASGDPFGALRPILRALAGIDEPRAEDGATIDAGAEVGRQLTGWVERLDPSQLPLLPLAALAFGATVAATPQASAVAPQFRQPTGNDVILSLLARALTVPTVVVIENTQWLDRASLELLEAASHRCGDRPWMIVTSSRPTAERIGRDSRIITVTPLPIDDAETIVAAVSDLPAERRREIARRSGGNPLFAVELARATDLGGQRPDSIEALITARIDRLGHDARVLVRTGAVLGQRFEVDLLQEVVGREILPDLKDLELLITVESAGGDGRGGDGARRAVFRSGVIRDVAYDGLPARRRRELHGAVATVLERRGDAPIAELAHHHAAAANHEAAWRYGRQAATEAGELGLLEDAFLHLQRAVAAADGLAAADGVDATDTAGTTGGVDRGDGSLPIDARPLGPTLVELFEVGIAAGRREEAVRHGQRAVALVDDPIERARLIGRVAAETAASDLSYRAQADRLRDLLDGLEPADGSVGERAWIGSHLAGLLFWASDWDGAVRAAETAIADAERAGLAAPRASALGIRFIVLSNRADPARLSLRREVIEAAERAGDDVAVGRAHNNVGADLERSGQWTEAIEHYDRAAAAAERRGDRHMGLIPSMNRAVLLGEQGHWDLALSLLDEVRREARHQGARLIEARAKLELGRVEILAGRPDEGRRWLTASLSFFEEAENRFMLYELAVLDMAADLAEGLSESVLSAAARLDAPDDRESDLVGRPETLTAYAHMQRGDHEAALAAAEQAVDLVVDDNRFGLALAMLARSEAEAFLGRGRTARRSREAAQAILDQLDVVAVPVVPLPK